METLERLRSILDNAPHGATHICEKGNYVLGSIYVGCCYPTHSGRAAFDRAVKMRSLADIQRIVDLMECNYE